MTTPDFPAGAPCWIDLLTSDEAGARTFYPAVFGWEAGEGAAEFGGYFMFTKDGVPVAGGMPTPPGMDLPDQWGIYLTVEDARKTVEVAQAHGATVRVEPMDVADLGTSAVIADPTGAQIGLWQPKSFPGFGAGSRAQPGTPAWFELLARGYETAVGFYRDVFGWDARTMADTPEFRYTTLGKDENARAGIMDAGGMADDEAGAGQWSMYISVDDTDATLAKITGSGGTVVRPGEDTPYGRLGIATDPSGALFKIMGPNKNG